MTFADHFSATAHKYAAHRPRLPVEMAQWLGEVAPSQRVALEVGCGSGQFTESLARVFERVYASDPAEAQLANAPTIPSVTFRRESAESLDAPAPADVVCAAQAAHWFDLPRFYEAAVRCLVNRGVLALIAYGPAIAPEPIRGAWDRFHDVTLAEFWPPERAHVVHRYRTLPFPFAELDAPTLRIERRWRLEAALGYVETWSGVRALERAGEGAKYSAFREGVCEAWGDPELERDFWFPVSVRATRVAR